MKNIIKILSILVCFALLFCSCSTAVITSETVIVDDVEEDGTSSSEITENITSSREENISSKIENVSSKKENISSKKETVESTNNISSDETKGEIKTVDFGHYKAQTTEESKLIVFSETKDFPAEDAYSVEVRLENSNSWITVPVYSAEVTRSGEHRNLKTYFASFDTDSNVRVKVTPKFNFYNCEIRPVDDAISYSASDSSVEFEVDKPLQLSVEFDGNIMENLQLFVNPIETDIPDIDDPSVIYVTPGVHDSTNSKYIKKGISSTKEFNAYDVIRLNEGDTLYLAGGAVLNAMVSVEPDAKNVRIYGRGIINNLHYNTSDGKYSTVQSQFKGSIPARAIMIRRSANVSIEGIIIRNSPSYSIMGNKVTNLTINNVKMFSRGQYCDGIDCVASTNVKISDCYIRANDDGIAIYASRWGYNGSSHNWNITNCVFMQDCAHAVNIGTHGSQKAEARDEIYDISFKDIDILDVYEGSEHYWGAIAFTVGDENYVHDFVFENIRMDGLKSSHPFTIKTDCNSSFNPNPGYKISNIKFKNVTLYGVDYMNEYNAKSIIKCWNKNRIVQNITFENLEICGKRVTNSNIGNFFEIDNNAKNIIIK